MYFVLCGVMTYVVWTIQVQTHVTKTAGKEALFILCDFPRLSYHRLSPLFTVV